MKTPITPQGLPPYIYGWEAGPNEKVWNEAAVRAALAAQAATLESIHKILQCAGPDAAGEIADLLGYPSVDWPSDQAASVEPVGRVAHVEWCSHEQKWRHVIWADKKMPFGTPVFASAPPSPASVPEVEAIKSLLSRIRPGVEAAPWVVEALQKIASAQHPAPSPAQAVDAVGESCAIFDSRGYYDWYDTEAQAKAWCDRYNARNVDDPLRPYTYVRLDALRAALQASRQPQAQQGGGENTARAFIEWCKAQPEDRVPVSIDEALNEFEAALATKEPK